MAFVTFQADPADSVRGSNGKPVKLEADGWREPSDDCDSWREVYRQNRVEGGY